MTKKSQLKFENYLKLNYKDTAYQNVQLQQYTEGKL
jgi:hypothetical protein